MNMTNKKMLLAGVVVSVGVAGSAAAGSIESALIGLASSAGLEGVPATYDFNDDFASVLIDVDSSGGTSIGDIILSSFVVNNVSTIVGLETFTANFGNSSDPFAGIGDTSATFDVSVIGRAAFEVAAPLDPGSSFSVNALESGDYDGIGIAGSDRLGSGVLFEVREVSPNNGAVQGALGFLDSFFQEGTIFAEVSEGTLPGFDFEPFGTGGSSIGETDGLPITGGTVLDIDSNILLAPAALVPPSNTVVSPSGFLAAGDASNPFAFDIFSTTGQAVFSVNATVVPSPTTAIFGMVGLGVMAVRRRRPSQESA